MTDKQIQDLKMDVIFFSRAFAFVSFACAIVGIGWFVDRSKIKTELEDITVAYNTSCGGDYSSGDTVYCADDTETEWGTATIISQTA